MHTGSTGNHTRRAALGTPWRETEATNSSFCRVMPLGACWLGTANLYLPGGPTTFSQGVIPGGSSRGASYLRASSASSSIPRSANSTCIPRLYTCIQNHGRTGIHESDPMKYMTRTFRERDHRHGGDFRRYRERSRKRERPHNGVRDQYKSLKRGMCSRSQISRSRGPDAQDRATLAAPRPLNATRPNTGIALCKFWVRSDVYTLSQNIFRAEQVRTHKPNFASLMIGTTLSDDVCTAIGTSGRSSSWTTSGLSTTGTNVGPCMLRKDIKISAVLATLSRVQTASSRRCARG
ncbi:hypothetical protein BD309DRAFT_967763 [Dichomitus squalens]|nr:hypothetical protein BD309DRAFT_967763 [Dichomitus squalens]